MVQDPHQTGALDPQVEALLDQIEEEGIPPFEEMSVPHGCDARWRLEASGYV